MQTVLVMDGGDSVNMSPCSLYVYFNHNKKLKNIIHEINLIKLSKVHV